MIKNNKKITIYFLLILTAAVPAYAAGTWNNTGAYYETNNTIVTTYNQSYVNISSTTNYVNIADQDVFSVNTATGFTISTWFNPTTDAFSGGGSLREGYIATKGNNSNYEWQLSYLNGSSSSPRQIAFALYNSSGTFLSSVSGYLNLANTKQFTPNQWYLITATVYNNTMSLYVNMDRVVLNKTWAGALSNGNSPVRIGMRADGVSSTYNGSIDNLRIFNSAIDGKQVQKIYLTDNQNTNITYIPVIYYHGVGTDGYSPVTEEDFDEQMQYLYDNGYTTLTISEFRNWLNGSTNYTKPLVIIFDDGIKSVRTYAYDVMSSYGMKGNAAILTDGVGASYYMNWSDINYLKNNGWDLLSHSDTHPNFLNINITQRATEFNTSYNEILTNTSSSPVGFVFPGNNQNSSILAECATYYPLCFGSARVDGEKTYTARYSNITNGELVRIEIGNLTSFDDFKSMVSIYDSNYYYHYDINSTLVGCYKFDEENGTTGYDCKGNYNSTLTSVNMRNHSSTRTLNRGIDYTTTALPNGSASLTWYQSFYNQMYYTYSYSSDLVVTSNSSQIVFNNTNSSTKYSLSIYNFSNVTVYTNNVWNRAYNSLITQADMDINASYNLLFLQGYYENPDVTVSICNNGLDGLNELGGWLPVIALIIGAAAVVGVLGFGKGIDSLNLESLGSAAITIVFTVIVIAVGATIISGAIC